MNNEPKVSQAFMSFAKNAPEHQKIWMETAQKLSDFASGLAPAKRRLPTGRYMKFCPCSWERKTLHLISKAGSLQL